MKFCFWLKQEKIELCIISLVILGSKDVMFPYWIKQKKKQFFISASVKVTTYILWDSPFKIL